MNRIRFEKDVEYSGKDIFYHIYDEFDKLIGTTEGYLNDYGELVSVVKISAERQRAGFGFVAFKKVFDELNIIVPITKIITSWSAGGEFGYCEDGMSTNLKIFIECLERNVNANDCAFSTPTGKWAKKLGFTKCKILYTGKEDASVEFFK